MYLPLPQVGASYGLKVRKNQYDFSYFSELFSVDNSDFYFDIEYLLPGGLTLKELSTGEYGYNAGALNLQLKSDTDYGDWVLYEFYIHKVDMNKEKTPESIFKSLIRNFKIDSILD